VRRYYFDTSAAVKMIRAEEHSVDVKRWVSDPEVEAASSSLLELEMRRAVMRWGLPQEEATRTLANFQLFSVPDWEFKAAGLMPVATLRSLDAIHVAAAIRIGADAIITYDERMIEAAALMGLPAIQPGVDDADRVTLVDA